MDRKHLPRFFLALVAFPIAAGCGQGPRAGEQGAAAAADPIGMTVVGDRVLLFMEHPQLVQGVPARFLAHLTVLGTGEPVRSGVVTLEVGPSVLRVDAPKREGLFIPQGSLPQSGSFPARLVVRSEQVEEDLDLGEMVVHDDEASAAAAASSGAEEPADTVPFLMEQQWKVKLLLARAEPRSLSERLIVPARAAAREGASAVVSSSLAGRLAVPPSGALPRTGERVEAAQVLALLEPPLGASDLAQLRAFDLQLDLEVLDVVRAIGEAEARLRFAERERERIAQLRAEGLSTQQQLDQAERDLAVAQNEVAAAARTKSSLDSLLASRGTRAEGGFAAARRFPLFAPISGAVVEVRRVQGESVGPDEPIFRILDSSRVRVDGRVFEFDLPRIGEASAAVATFAALPGRRFELGGVSGGRPYIGQEVDASSRTLLVRYEMENPDGAVRPGMLAELEIATGSVEAAVAIPTEAVVMDQGLATAYVMLEGELFQKRELGLGVKDGGMVEVLRGLEPGERVATRGAYIVKLAALSPASFGAGHAH
jgi:cobalt-zinc-cadmium efflux system membrane fusion protein